MLVDFIFLLILFGLLYSYMNSQNQFAATASAIRQIWSGSCRLSCRHSEHSALSGLSGLPPRPSGGYGTGAVGQGLITARGSIQIPESNRECSCESCPCALIENFLRQWRPATTLYAQLIECVSNLICFLIHWLLDVYERVIGAFECEVTCTQHPKLTYKSEPNSKDKISVGPNEELPAKAKIPTPKSSFSKLIPKNQIPAIKETKSKAERRDDEASNQVGTSKSVTPKVEDIPPLPKVLKDNLKDNLKDKDKASITPADSPKIMGSSSNSSELMQKGFCSKCIEKGRTCISECPRAKKPK